MSAGPLGLAEARDSEGKPLISDTALCALLPPNVRKMTEKYKKMCGCEPCISVTQLHMSLNSCRLCHLKCLRESGRQATREGQRARTRANDYANVIYANDQHLHPKPKDALLAIQCHPVEGMPVPHFKCIL